MKQKAVEVTGILRETAICLGDSSGKYFDDETWYASFVCRDRMVSIFDGVIDVLVDEVVFNENN